MSRADQLARNAAVAVIKRHWDSAIKSARSALEIEPSSQTAAAMCFSAHWGAQQYDLGAEFILEFINKYGASQTTLQCAVAAMVSIDYPKQHVSSWAARWLDALPDNDIRKAVRREGDRDLLVLDNGRLADRSDRVGPPIASFHGSISAAVKTMNRSHMNHRWAYPTYHVVRDIKVLPESWFVFDDHSVYFSETMSWPQIFRELTILREPMSHSIIVHSASRSLVQAPRSTEIVPGRCILLGCNPNFYYWLVNNVARLASIQADFDLKSARFLIDEAMPDTHLQTLWQLGFSDQNLIRVPSSRVLMCEELIVPTMLASLDVVHPAAIQWLRSVLGPKSIDPNFPKRIFVSRSKPHRRKFANEEDVFRALSQIGFQKVTPDTLSFADQVNAFQNAEIVVSPFGTCLAGLIFAPPTCSTFEIIDAKSVPMHRYMENIAIHLGQRFQCVFPCRVRRPEGTASLAVYDFDVDPLELECAIAKSASGL